MFLEEKLSMDEMRRRRRGLQFGVFYVEAAVYRMGGVPTERLGWVLLKGLLDDETS